MSIPIIETQNRTHDQTIRIECIQAMNPEGFSLFEQRYSITSPPRGRNMLQYLVPQLGNIMFSLIKTKWYRQQQVPTSDGGFVL